jgi:hypothetical protein
MTAIMLAEGPNFRPPRIRGISHMMPDGSVGTTLNASVHMVVRTAAFVNVRLIGPDGKEIVQNKGSTEDQVTLQLAAKNERLRRAQVLYGTLKHDWVYLFKVLEVMEMEMAARQV